MLVIALIFSPYTMIILKFGGSSVQTPERIRAVVDILREYAARGTRLTVVFSAYGGITDKLIEAGKLAEQGRESYRELYREIAARHLSTVESLLRGEQLTEIRNAVRLSLADLEDILHGVFLLKELSKRSLDYIASFGERLSAFTVAGHMAQEDLPVVFLDARHVIKTDATFGAAKVDFEKTNPAIQSFFKDIAQPIVVTTGFIGSTDEDVTTTLGRGGSDYTASIFGAALDAEVIEIWTDVDGVMTTDPRKVKDAFSIPRMTYNEAMEMSHFGAKVIYAPTILPALSKRIPLRIKNTFRPKFPGTFISEQPDPDFQHPVKGIASIGEISLITIEGTGIVGVHGFAERLFGALAQAHINIVLITQASSEHSITFAVEPHNGGLADQSIRRAFDRELAAGQIEAPRVESDMSILAVIGENMRFSPGVAGRFFGALGKNGINIAAIAQGSSELNISTVISRKDLSKALNVIHESFFLSGAKVLNLFVVGVGLIGKTLLRQLAEQAPALAERHKLIVRIVGLANSRQMIFDEKGIDLLQWASELENGRPMSMVRFVEKMQALNLSNAIFVDNTASADVAHHYESIFNASISVSASNKTAAASPLENFRRLKETAQRRGVRFCFETNVGAGLPILNTLGDLVASGDRILRIEAVLSGSLSFIFNHFQTPARFIDTVREAKALGYTEPDPRDDLSGLDVARKLLILARESGWEMEMADIIIHPILPEACLAAPDVDSFFEALEKAESTFAERLGSAEATGKALRFVGKVENGRASVSLEAIGPEHPFFHLSGSDNMIVFTTERYHNRPLVVRGPGAGADVTAAGVFAEIIRIGNFLS